MVSYTDKLATHLADALCNKEYAPATWEANYRILRRALEVEDDRQWCDLKQKNFRCGAFDLGLYCLAASGAITAVQAIIHFLARWFR